MFRTMGISGKVCWIYRIVFWTCIVPKGAWIGSIYWGCFKIAFIFNGLRSFAILEDGGGVFASLLLFPL